MTHTHRADLLTLRDQVRLLSGSTFWSTQPLPDAGIPAVLMSDGPHGVRRQQSEHDHLGLAEAEPATCFPPAVTLASSWDVELVEEVGRALGDEARALGVQVLLGPGTNIKRHPRCGRNFEYFSEDPLLSGRLAAAWIDGLQSRGVGACLKHFAVNNQEAHRFVVDAVVDERTLRELYLPAFEYAVTQARPWSVMASYNAVNGRGVTEDPWLLTTVLREEWGFDGLVVSDWCATRDRVLGVRAGMDLEMPTSKGLSDADVVAAVRSGSLDADEVTTSAQRVLDLVARATPPAPTGLAALLEPHDALARRAAAAGTVLLANDGILPLERDRLRGGRLAVIGAFAEQPRFQGAGSSRVTPTRVTGLHEALTEALAGADVDLVYAAGYDPVLSEPSPALVQEAVRVAADADAVVLLVGLPDVWESEGFDRDHLRLPDQHDALVEAVCDANPRTVVALANGAPVAMPWRTRPAAVLEAYLGGQAGGAALADVLLGDAEPGGRLAETFPVDETDLAATAWYPGPDADVAPRQVEHREGLMVGYRDLTTRGRQPLWAFGHGLGYTSFAWADARLDRTRIRAGRGVTVTLTVTNTGERAGADVVQVYLADRTGVVLRPRRELAGFAKVHLAAGESREVTVDVPARSFAFFDVPSGQWRTPSGPYDVEVARSSVDVVDTLDLTVTHGVRTSDDPAEGPAVTAADADFARRLGRPVPTPTPVRPFTRDSTMEELATTYVGRALLGIIKRVSDVDREPDLAQRRMMERSIDELPLRGTAAFSGGMLRWPVVDLVLDLANRRPDRVPTRLVPMLLPIARGLARKGLRRVTSLGR